MDGRSKPRPGVEAQRRAILEAALALFGERGSSQTSIAELCRHAGVSRPTFYRCFEDKDAVVAALYDEAVHSPIRDALVAMQRAETEGEAVVGRVVDAIFDQRAHAEFLFAEARDPDSPAAAMIRAAYAQIVPALQAGQRARGLRESSPIVLEALLVAWQWMVATHLSEGDAARAKVRDAAWELTRQVFTAR